MLHAPIENGVCSQDTTRHKIVFLLQIVKVRQVFERNVIELEIAGIGMHGLDYFA